MLTLKHHYSFKTANIHAVFFVQYSEGGIDMQKYYAVHNICNNWYDFVAKKWVGHCSSSCMTEDYKQAQEIERYSEYNFLHTFMLKGENNAKD